MDLNERDYDADLINFKAYASVNDFLFRFEEQLRSLGSADVTTKQDDFVIKKALSDATSEMNLDIGLLYDIELIMNSQNVDLKRMCCDLAFYNLLKRKRAATREDKATYFDPVKSDLREIGAGTKVLLGFKPRKKSPGDYLFDREYFTNRTMDNWDNFLK